MKVPVSIMPHDIPLSVQPMKYAYATAMQVAIETAQMTVTKTAEGGGVTSSALLTERASGHFMAVPRLVPRHAARGRPAAVEPAELILPHDLHPCLLRQIREVGWFIYTNLGHRIHSKKLRFSSTEACHRSTRDGLFLL